MERKDYVEPTMKVVQLKHQCHILEGSDTATTSASRNGYGEAITDTWGNE